MKTVILCGGYGTRIRDVAEDVPKPMIPVGGLPILWHIMKIYSHAGFKEFVLCLGYKSFSIKNFFLNYESQTNDFTVSLGRKPEVTYHSSHAESDWRVTLAETGLKAMTGARVRRVAKYLQDDEDFFLTYGDGVGNVDLHALLEFHKAHGKMLTVTGVRPPGRFGELEHENSRVLGFNEKPQVTTGRISAGFFVCKRAFLEQLNDREDLVLEQDPFRALVRAGEMMLYEHDGFWHPMDTYRDYAYLNGLVEKGEAPWVSW